MLVLYHSIIKFDDRLFCFYSFFERNLINKLITLKNKIIKKPLIYVRDTEVLKESSVTLPDELPDDNMFNDLTSKEKLIINLYCLKKNSVKQICATYDMKLQEVYYILRKARDKIRHNLDK